MTLPMIFQKRFAHADDWKLVSLAAKGNESAFGELLKRHQESVYGFAFRFIKDSREAENIAREVFLGLCQTAGENSPDGSFRTYLFQIARNLCIDFLQKSHSETMAHPPETVEIQTLFDRFSETGPKGRFLNAVSRLPNNRRAAILLRHDQGMNYKEVAEAMRLNVTVVESILDRARRTLQSRLSDLL